MNSHVPLLAVENAHGLRDEGVVVEEGGVGNFGLQREPRVKHHGVNATGNHLGVLPTQCLGHKAINLRELGPGDAALSRSIVKRKQVLDAGFHVARNLLVLHLVQRSAVHSQPPVKCKFHGLRVFVVQLEAGDACRSRSWRFVVVGFHRGRVGDDAARGGVGRALQVHVPHGADQAALQNGVLTLLDFGLHVRALGKVLHDHHLQLGIERGPYFVHHRRTLAVLVGREAVSGHKDDEVERIADVGGALLQVGDRLVALIAGNLQGRCVPRHAVVYLVQHLLRDRRLLDGARETKVVPPVHGGVQPPLGHARRKKKDVGTSLLQTESGLPLKLLFAISALEFQEVYESILAAVREVEGVGADFRLADVARVVVVFDLHGFVLNGALARDVVDQGARLLRGDHQLQRVRHEFGLEAVGCDDDPHVGAVHREARPLERLRLLHRKTDPFLRVVVDVQRELPRLGRVLVVHQHQVVHGGGATGV
mmetsp:Transcript_19756/g.49666  ORF Transcript_19756/g.49666 Transcript_19756/m.49666 type:complete len:480 (+) Transcript_19756:2981-4420(+)